MRRLKAFFCRNLLVGLLILQFFLQAFLSGGVVQAQSFVFKHYQIENGLSYNSVLCSMQDKKGFMWFGTKNGLNRFDGYTFKIYQRDPTNQAALGDNIIYSLFEDKNGILWIGTHSGLYNFDPATEKFTLVEGTRNYIIREIKGDAKAHVWFIASLILTSYNTSTRQVHFYDKEASDATSIGSIDQDKIWFSTKNGYIRSFNFRKNYTESYNISTIQHGSNDLFIEKMYSAASNLFLVSTAAQGIKIFNTANKSFQDILPRDENGSAIHARDILYMGGDTYWFGSEAGVFIFDLKNRSYKKLRHYYNDPYSLSDNSVYALTKDREGGVWVGTYFGGINYYPRQYNSFHNFFNKGAASELKGKAVRELAEDKYGNLWVGTEDEGLNRLSPDDHTFTHYLSATTVPFTNIHGLLADGDQLWVGTFQDGISVLQLPGGKAIKRFTSGPDSNSLKSNFIETLYKTRAGDIMIGTSAGLYKYNRVRQNFSSVKEVPPNLHYVSVIEDKNGTIWVGSLRDGLYYFNPRTRQKGSFMNDPDNKNSLSSNFVNSLFIDSQHHLWVSTENGLCRYNSSDQNFNVFSKKDGFSSNIFYKILEDNSKHLWISTGNGLACFNPLEGKIENYTKSDGLLTDQFNYSSAFKRKDGQMYFGSVKGLLRFNPSTFSKSKFSPPVYITGIQVDNDELHIKTEGSPLKQSITLSKEIRLNFNQSTFSIDFAALSFSAPENIQYAYKMEGLDKSWIYLKTNRKVYFTNLAPGSYVFKVKASNSSGIWNENITQLKIIITPPFWASKIAYLLYLIIALALGYLLIREYNQRANRRNRERLKELESQKEKELYHAKIEFFTYVTHEIRTPLTLIKAPLEDVLDQVKGSAEVNKNLLTIKKNTNRLLDLTNQLLDFRKTESKGFRLNFIPTDISKLLVDTYNRFKPAVDQRRLNVDLNIPKEAVIAYADPEAMNKILSNLIDNAVKYAISHIRLRLYAGRAMPKTFVVEVISDGNLIPDTDRDKIFEPFYRMEADKNKRGTGIGLPLARSLAELHEGELTLSTDSNRMNVFSLILPFNHAQSFDLVPVAEEDQYRSEGNLPDERESGFPAILIVEDNVEIMDFIEQKLSSQYFVLRANNGHEATQILKENAVQLIVSDVMMPVMDGLELCKYVKNNVEFNHIPIILLTAKSTVQAKIEGLETGAEAYIEKPFSPQHLLTQISSLLANREKIKNHFASSPLVHIKAMAYNKTDEQFLEKLNEAIHKNLANPLFDVDVLAECMNMSRPTLYRKIKVISNLSPRDLILITRLKKAAELLVESDYKIAAVSKLTGFSSQGQLSRSFSKQFGMTPSEYANSKNGNRTNINKDL
ncbi:hybrid sensor histidine kinase/response regulator transcription factor [Desertivirga arenae]|uniref:hybrid sensor histidine kinase/response regulator transcription factor n=1 Tax=Desertivirga arenae TaxID=2810309 RepID=UPI001A972536|nr:two-component regulator propeller domain-containing protein [Pedobacter sp. SYSU D00823]